MLNLSSEKAAAAPLPAITEVDVLEAFECHSIQVCRYVKTILRDAAAAEDITQETFLRYFEQLRRGHVVYNAKAWLFRAAHNIALNHIRDHGKLFQLEDPRIPSCQFQGPTPEFSYERGNRRLEAALRQLSPQEQRCIELRAEGLLYREIADLLGVRVSSVSNYMDRAIGKLRQAVCA